MYMAGVVLDSMSGCGANAERAAPPVDATSKDWCGGEQSEGYSRAELGHAACPSKV